jgi:hypothetical protein
MIQYRDIDGTLIRVGDRVQSICICGAVLWEGTVRRDCHGVYVEVAREYRAAVGSRLEMMADALKIVTSN